MTAKTPAQRRREADARKKEQGMYQTTAWVHEKNRAAFSQLRAKFEKPLLMHYDAEQGAYIIKTKD